MFSWSWYSTSWKITWPTQWLSFLPERIKIEKVEKLVANLHDKTKYFIHIRNLKQALNHRLVLKGSIEWLNLITMLGKNHILIWILI